MKILLLIKHATSLEQQEQRQNLEAFDLNFEGTHYVNVIQYYVDLQRASTKAPQKNAETFLRTMNKAVKQIKICM